MHNLCYISHLMFHSAVFCTVHSALFLLILGLSPSKIFLKSLALLLYSAQFIFLVVPSHLICHCCMSKFLRNVKTLLRSLMVTLDNTCNIWNAAVITDPFISQIHILVLMNFKVTNALDNQWNDNLWRLSFSLQISLILGLGLIGDQ